MGGQVQLPVGRGGVREEVMGEDGQVQPARVIRGGVGGEVMGGGAIGSPIRPQQRDVGGKFRTLPDTLIAAADLGEKTGSGGTAGSTAVQYKKNF